MLKTSEIQEIYRNYPLVDNIINFVNINKRKYGKFGKERKLSGKDLTSFLIEQLTQLIDDTIKLDDIPVYVEDLEMNLCEDDLIQCVQLFKKMRNYDKDFDFEVFFQVFFSEPDTASLVKKNNVSSFLDPSNPYYSSLAIKISNFKLQDDGFPISLIVKDMNGHFSWEDIVSLSSDLDHYIGEPAIDLFLSSYHKKEDNCTKFFDKYIYIWKYGLKSLFYRSTISFLLYLNFFSQLSVFYKTFENSNIFYYYPIFFLFFDLGFLFDELMMLYCRKRAEHFLLEKKCIETARYYKDFFHSDEEGVFYLQASHVDGRPHITIRSYKIPGYFTLTRLSVGKKISPTKYRNIGYRFWFINFNVFEIQTGCLKSNLSCTEVDDHEFDYFLFEFLYTRNQIVNALNYVCIENDISCQAKIDFGKDKLIRGTEGNKKWAIFQSVYVLSMKYYGLKHMNLHCKRYKKEADVLLKRLLEVLDSTNCHHFFSLDYKPDIETYEEEIEVEEEIDIETTSIQPVNFKYPVLMLKEYYHTPPDSFPELFEKYGVACNKKTKNDVKNYWKWLNKNKPSWKEDMFLQNEIVVFEKKKQIVKKIVEKTRVRNREIQESRSEIYKKYVIEENIAVKRRRVLQAIRRHSLLSKKAIKCEDVDQYDLNCILEKNITPEKIKKWNNFENKTSQISSIRKKIYNLKKQKGSSLEVIRSKIELLINLKKNIESETRILYDDLYRYKEIKVSDNNFEEYQRFLMIQIITNNSWCIKKKKKTIEGQEIERLRILGNKKSMNLLKMIQNSRIIL
jgi:hypothetical protein